MPGIKYVWMHIVVTKFKGYKVDLFPNPVLSPETTTIKIQSILTNIFYSYVNVYAYLIILFIFTDGSILSILFPAYFFPLSWELFQDSTCRVAVFFFNSKRMFVPLFR